MQTRLELLRSTEERVGPDPGGGLSRRARSRSARDSSTGCFRDPGGGRGTAATMSPQCNGAHSAALGSQICWDDVVVVPSPRTIDVCFRFSSSFGLGSG
jgi:hypothetical protein